MNKHPEDLRTASEHRGAGHVDYRETSDITEAHGAVEREHSVGTPGGVPVPLWLLGVCAVAVFWAGAYLGMFSGGFSANTFDESAGQEKGPPPGLASATGAAGGAAQSASPKEEGKKYFTQNCASCHQASGLGVPNQFPPLAKSEYVTGSPKRLALILLKGLQGPVTVEGAHFNGAMPAWEKNLNDKKIAYILTYIRQEWGNNASEITPEQIAAARKEFASHAEAATEADLQAIPADAALEGGAAPAAGAAPAPAAGAEAKK